MTAIILIFGKVCFSIMGIAIGGKLASDLRTEGGFGLHALALSAIAIGGLGLVTVSLGEGLDSPRVAFAGDVGMHVGVALLSIFVWKTFRRTEILGAIAAFVCTTALFATFAWDTLSQPSLMNYDYGRPSAHAYQIGIALPFIWAAIETAALWSRGKRRLKLGLADPILVQSYLLWTVSTSAFVGICVLAVVAGEASDAGLPTLADAAQMLRGLLYFAISISLWIGFFPRAGASEASEPIAES